MTGGPEFLPYGRQEIGPADIAAVTDVLGSPLITQGPRVAEFEAAICDHTGAAHAVAFSSGTAALHGCAVAAGLGPGDVGVVPPITFAASANCLLYAGATPEFADIDPATLNLDAAAAAAADERIKAFVPVSFAGLPAELGPLTDSGRIVIEDAAHAIGAIRDGRPVGGPGGATMTAFSFHPVKTMTTGEGGAVTTEDAGLADRLRRFREHGIERSPADADGPWAYEITELGFNYRITDIQCALGIAQISRLEGWVEARNRIAATYREALAAEERLVLPPAAPDGSRHAYHLFVVQVRAGSEARRQVFERLRERGIGVQVHYVPTYRFRFWRETLGYPQDTCPNAESYYAGAISLPVFPAMTDADIERVVAELGAALDETTPPR